MPPVYEGHDVQRYAADPHDFTIPAAATFALVLLRNTDAGGVVDALTATLEGATMTARDSESSGTHVAHAFDRLGPATGSGVTFDWSAPTTAPSFWQLAAAFVSGVHPTTPVRDAVLAYSAASQDYMEASVASAVGDLVVGALIAHSASFTASARDGSAVETQSAWDSVVFATFTKAGAAGTVTAGVNFSAPHAERRFLLLYSLRPPDTGFAAEWVLTGA